MGLSINVFYLSIGLLYEDGELNVVDLYLVLDLVYEVI